MDTTLVSTDTAPADRISQDDTPPDLTYLNGFSRDDLACNREGRLSENQRLELRSAIRGDALGTAVVLAFVVVGFSVSHGIVGAVFAGAVLVFGAVQLIRRITELRQGAVYEVVGDAWPEFVPDSEGPDRYWLHIGDLKLEISETSYATFRRGGPYRIYYMATSNTVIGGEVLPDWRPLPAPSTPRHWWQNLSIEIG